MGYGQGETHRYRRVHGIAAGFQNFQADFGGTGLPGYHHALAPAHRLGGPNRQGNGYQQ